MFIAVRHNSAIYHMVVNFHWVQIFMDFGRFCYPRKITKVYYIHGVLVIILYHKRVGPLNHLSFQTHFNPLKITTHMVLLHYKL